ncbi:uncharacterized protein PITG_09323 [Phytophthora infestans T30-4]|uniref:Uncharacterized protein n=1 Tax=Phytophthora infestans (strain T30-4) TaxID=403677 RepID=D0NBF3_PHYIT|nr:uncharacterized protein PITG_09323 [Phytophthora infestans T30-4]EEY55382.1 hypothetical protein PITG_09323 [Phytophthora infestans T30-4]|eukprot:XP_002903606.1 hypothetical protein PITG_09323 [Phytophthora infestans T30-4]
MISSTLQKGDSVAPPPIEVGTRALVIIIQHLWTALVKSKIDDWRQRRRKFTTPHDRLNTVVATGKADDGSVWRGSNSGKSAATIATPGLDRVWPADDASLSSRGCSAGAAGAALRKITGGSKVSSEPSTVQQQRGGRRAIASTSISSLVTVASCDKDTSNLWHDTAPAISSTILRSVSSLMPGMAVRGVKSWLMTADDAW